MAELLFVNGDSYTYPDTALQSTLKKSFIITNTGSGIATNIQVTTPVSVPFQFPDGSFTGDGGTCSYSLLPDQSCFFTIAFTPTSEGSFSDVLEISYENGDGQQTLSLSLEGAGFSFISDNGIHDFGTVLVDASSPTSFTLTNGSDQPLINLQPGSDALGSPFSYEGGSFPGNSGTCGSSLSPGATCNIVMLFSPESAGTYQDITTLSFDIDGVKQEVPVELMGTGAYGASSFSILTANNAVVYPLGDMAELKLFPSDPNPVGAYNGGGTGNKAILGITDYDGILVSDFQGIAITFKTNLVSFYINFLVDLNCDSMNPDYAIIVMYTDILEGYDDGLWHTVSFTKDDAAFTAVDAVGGKACLPRHYAQPAAPFTQVYNGDGGTCSGYPNACFVNADSEDGGMPANRIQPAIMFVLGSSGTLDGAYAVIDEVTLEFNSGTDIYDFSSPW